MGKCADAGLLIFRLLQSLHKLQVFRTLVVEQILIAIEYIILPVLAGTVQSGYDFTQPENFQLQLAQIFFRRAAGIYGKIGDFVSVRCDGYGPDPGS